LFDAAADRAGERLGGLVIQPMTCLDRVIAVEWISIGVIATPASAAQDVASRLVEAGVTSILNFATSVPSVLYGDDLRKVDLSNELQILAYHEQSKALLEPESPVVGEKPVDGEKVDL